MASFADDLFVLQGFGLSLSGVRALMLAALHDARNCGSAANMGRLESCLTPAIRLHWMLSKQTLGKEEL